MLMNITLKTNKVERETYFKISNTKIENQKKYREKQTNKISLKKRVGNPKIAVSK